MIESRPALRIRLANMVRADLPACVRIGLGTVNPWSEESLTHVLRQRDVLGLTAYIHGGQWEPFVGFALYRLCERVMGCIDLVVDPNFRRRGVGTALANRLVQKMTSHRKEVAVVQVRESHLGAQLFWRSVGFMAERIRDRFYADGETAYEFAMRVGTGGH